MSKKKFRVRAECQACACGDITFLGPEKLKEKFKDAISDREKQIESFKTLLSEEIEFEGYTTKLENLPDQIEPAVIEVLIKTGLIDE